MSKPAEFQVPIETFNPNAEFITICGPLSGYLYIALKAVESVAQGRADINKVNLVLKRSGGFAIGTGKQPGYLALKRDHDKEKKRAKKQRLAKPLFDSTPLAEPMPSTSTPAEPTPSPIEMLTALLGEHF